LAGLGPSTGIVSFELESLSRRTMQEMIPFVGPQTDMMAAEIGTNAQPMDWFMDTTRGLFP
jgi:glutamate dehydrogenase (NAD(P)+)